MKQFYSWREAPEGEYAVIGYPVKHSLSPPMHRAAYEALGLPLRYHAIEVPEGEVPEALEHLGGLGYRGVNVTVPHKEAALEWCRDAQPMARRVRAANTLRLADWVCINTDAPGFLNTLRDLGVTPGVVLLLGAGGSARALAYALAHEGWRLRIYNRTRARAEEMLQGLDIEAELLEQPDPTGADLLLNTTSASLQSAAIPLPWDCVQSSALAYDLMYAKEPTPFLAAAQAAGLATCDGLPMLVEQGALSFEWWTGAPAPRDAMRAAVGLPPTP